MVDLLSELNDSQREAVEYIDGPSLVIAGAGSGKTRVLTYKIAYLLHRGVRPYNILALTFTNKAATEMKARIGKLVGERDALALRMGTFHSVFSRILRVEAAHIGYNSNFTIYDESDSRSLIKTIVKELAAGNEKMDEKQYKPATVHNCISRAKNRLITAEKYANDSALMARDRQQNMPAISRIYTLYADRCRQANAMDFDDLLVLTYQLFAEHPDIREKYAHHFEYVLVDEYQDTNYVQQCIVLQLTRDHQRVCVVGDDYQSIYGFRGANIDNILQFNELYNDPKLFKLEQNYRSTRNIVKAANSLMKHNERQIPKDVYSENDEGEKLIYKPAYSDKEEAVIVCNEIKRIKRKEGGDYRDFAILYRTNSQSRSLEEEMKKQHIPYRIYGGLSFYQRKEIKDIIAYFRLVINPDDEEAFKRIINYPARGIGNTTIQKIAATAVEQGVSFWTVIMSPGHYGLSVNKGTLAKLDAFRSLISSFMLKSLELDAYQLGQMIIKESGISKDIFSGVDPESLSRQQNLEEFLAGMQDFVESQREEGNENQVFLADFLQEVSLLTDLDSDEGDDTNRVVMMTIHAAKGLEFPTVFIVGLEENIFPSPLSANSPRELEEERRLLYVAITRAERHCILTNAQNRWRFGSMQFDTPSRFIYDIDPSLIEEERMGASYSGGKSFRTGRNGGSYGDAFQDLPFSRNDTPEWMEDRLGYLRPASSSYQGHTPTPRAVYQPSQKVERGSGAPGSVSGMQSLKPMRQVAETPSSPSSSVQVGALAEGTVIEHQRFGIGTVIKVEGSGENAKATIEFKNTGTKQLLLKFARYTIIK